MCMCQQRSGVFGALMLCARNRACVTVKLGTLITYAHYLLALQAPVVSCGGMLLPVTVFGLHQWHQRQWRQHADSSKRLAFEMEARKATAGRQPEQRVKVGVGHGPHQASKHAKPKHGSTVRCVNTRCPLATAAPLMSYVAYSHSIYNACIPQKFTSVVGNAEWRTGDLLLSIGTTVTHLITWPARFWLSDRLDC